MKWLEFLTKHVNSGRSKVLFVAIYLIGFLVVIVAEKTTLKEYIRAQYWVTDSETMKDVIDQVRGHHYMVDQIDIRKGHLLRHFCDKNAKFKPMDPSVKETIWTGWGVLHMILYFFIGFFCPKLFWLSVIMGFFWELVEYFSQDCHDLFDFFNNIAGFGLGAAVRYCVSKPS